MMVNKYRHIVKLHAQGMHNQAIVETLGTSSQYVSAVLKAEGLKRNKMNVRAELYWQREAARRGVSVAVLKRRILDIIHKDKMVDAILDDEDECNVGKTQATGQRSDQGIGAI